MNIISLKSPGLAHLSYLVSSKQEAAVIDPRRDVLEYVRICKDRGLNLKYVLETHRNEDYVSGALELADALGAEVYHGEQLDFAYGNPLSDGQVLKLGNLKIKALHTPGHTIESFCYLVEEKKGPVALFTGDSLFVGEVGRTDLSGEGVWKELSEKLFHSIQEKILPLGDSVMIFPGHGAGSVCGHAIAEREISTIGLEKRDNPLLRLVKEDFVQHKITEKMDRAAYFRVMEEMNLNGPPSMPSFPGIKRISSQELIKHQQQGALVLDARYPQSFAAAHIPGALNIMKDGIASYGGFVIAPGSRMVLVTVDAREAEEAAIFLMRMGFDDVLGHLNNGMESWIKEGRPLQSLGLLSPKELNDMIEAGEPPLIIDVRDEQERSEGIISGAVAVSLESILSGNAAIDGEREAVYYCASGYRGSTAASIMKARGHLRSTVLLGGIGAWIKAGFPILQSDEI